MSFGILTNSSVHVGFRADKLSEVCPGGERNGDVLGDNADGIVVADVRERWIDGSRGEQFFF